MPFLLLLVAAFLFGAAWATRKDQKDLEELGRRLDAILEDKPCPK